MFADRSRTWMVRGHGQTAVVVADWLRTRTDCGRGCGLDKASRPDNGAGISRLNRDFFADIRALKFQGVRRPTLNPHKSCGHLCSVKWNPCWNRTRLNGFADHCLSCSANGTCSMVLLLKPIILSVSCLRYPAAPSCDDLRLSLLL